MLIVYTKGKRRGEGRSKEIEKGGGGADNVRIKFIKFKGLKKRVKYRLILFF